MRIIPFYYDDYDDLFANAYVLVDSQNNALIIDPSKDYDGLINYIEKNSLNLKGVLLTHAHFDHIRGAKRLVDKYNCPVYIGFEDEMSLKSPTLNCSGLMGTPYSLDVKAETLSDGQILTLLEEEIKCIHTPFHTVGSYCFYLEKSKALFTGDFIFAGSVGRSDLPNASPKSFNQSVKKILSLPEETKIYPGHGPSSSLKEEKNNNYFLK